MAAPNAVPRFVLPENNLGNGVISVANTNRDGTGTIVDIFTAGLQGTLLTKIRAIAQGTTTAGMIRLYIYNGAAYRLWQELAVTAIVPSGTVKCFEIELTFDKEVVLPTGYKLGAAPHNAETFNVFAYGGNY